MSSPQSQPDEIQKLWQENCAMHEKEDPLMLMRLLQEKQRSFRDSVSGDDYAGYMIILMCAPLTAFAAWKAHPLILMQLGYLIWTVMFVAGAAVAWISARKACSLCGIDLSIRAYHRELQQLYERRIRFLKGIKYWFSIPFVVGMFLVLSSVAGRILAKPWDLFLVIALMLLWWLAVWYQNDVRGVRRILARKSEVDALLDQMNKA